MNGLYDDLPDPVSEWFLDEVKSIVCCTGSSDGCPHSE
jgi:hypothetical protein